MRRTKQLETGVLARLQDRLARRDALRTQYRKRPLEFLGRKGIGSRYMGPMREMFLDIYEGRVDSAVGLACRGGGKTKGVAELGSCEWMFQDWNVFVVSGSLDQAMCTLEYVQVITGDEEVEDLIENQTKTLVKSKDGNWIRAVAASTKAVRGPHARGRNILLILDEEAEMQPDVVRAALNIGNDAERFVVVRVSTMHKLVGTFKELVDRHKQMGYKLYRWDAFDISRSCTTPKCKDCLAAFRKDNPPELIDKLTDQFHDFCKERPKQKGRTEGWIKVETIRRKFFELPLSWFLSEVMALEPSGEGLILPYRKTKAAIEATLATFVKGARIFGAVDWAFSPDQMVGGVFQQVGSNLIPLDAMAWVGVDEEMLELWFRGKEEDYGQPLSVIYPDSSHPFNNNLLREAGWDVDEVVFGAYKETGAGKLNWLFERERVKFAFRLNDDATSQMLGWSRGADGRIKKGHDHYCDMFLCATKGVLGLVGVGRARFGRLPRSLDGSGLLDRLEERGEQDLDRMMGEEG